MLLTVASAGNPIASIAIHDGGSSFIIDTLKFESAPPVLTCTDLVQQLYNGVNALPVSDFKNIFRAIKQRTSLKREIDYFESLVAANAPNGRLHRQLAEIKSDITEAVKSTPSRNNLLKLIKQIVTMIKVNQC
jgi:hypothetical protein